MNILMSRCPSCKGFWADEQKIAPIYGEAIAAKLKVPQFAMKAMEAQCPCCNVPLFEFCYPNSEVFIDGCRQCHGIWFDDAELKAIKKAEEALIDVACPRCQSSNSLLPEALATASCISCGSLLQPPVGTADPYANLAEDGDGDNPVCQPDVEDIDDALANPVEDESWSAVKDIDLEYKLCLFAIPAMLVIGILFNLTGMGASIQRIWLTMPVHELGHAITAWFTGYNAIPSLWVTQIFSDSRGWIAPLMVLGAIGFGARYAYQHKSKAGLITCAVLLFLQIIGTLVLSPNTANLLITFGGDGVGLILATILMCSFYHGKNTNLYKGMLRWGFVAIGAAAFVDIYSVWFSAIGDYAKVPYGTTGGRFTDSYKMIEHHGWSFDTLIGRYNLLGNICLVVLGVAYYFGLRKVKLIKSVRKSLF
jgi:Zn-finger nucleic acid-binding protein